MPPQNFRLPPAAAPLDRIKEYLAALRGLTPADLRSVFVTLQAALTSTTPGTDDYKVPAGWDFSIFRVHGFLSFNALNTEPTSILSWLNLDVINRYLIKLSNCTARLENKDKNDLFSENRDVFLSAITPPYGSPIDLPPDAPIVVPAGQIIRATFTLQDSTTNIVGNSSDYGLVLTGVLTPAS